MISKLAFMARVETRTPSQTPPSSPGFQPLDEAALRQVAGGWDTGWQPYDDYWDKPYYDQYWDWNSFDEGYYDWFQDAPIIV